MSWRDGRMAAISQAGLVEKFVDALCDAFWAWLPQGRSSIWLLRATASLIAFAWLLPLAAVENAGRAYAARHLHRGIFVVPVAWRWWRRRQSFRLFRETDPQSGLGKLLHQTTAWAACTGGRMTATWPAALETMPPLHNDALAGAGQAHAHVATHEMQKWEPAWT